MIITITKIEDNNVLLYRIYPSRDAPHFLQPRSIIEQLFVRSVQMGL